MRYSDSRSSTLHLLLAAFSACTLAVAAESARMDLPAPGPDVDIKADIWIEGELPAAHNLTHVRREESCFGGKFLFLHEAALPATNRFFANYAFSVEKKGKYVLYGAIQRPQVKWSSPASVSIDDGKFILLTDSDAKLSWGLSRAVTWVHLGEYEFEAGKHRLEFEVKEQRELGKNFAFMVDAIAGFRVVDKPASKP